MASDGKTLFRPRASGCGGSWPLAMGSQLLVSCVLVLHSSCLLANSLKAAFGAVACCTVSCHVSLQPTTMNGISGGSFSVDLPWLPLRVQSESLCILWLSNLSHHYD